MPKVLRNRTTLRHVLLLLVIPIALSGTTYALFSQQLSVNASTDKPAYTSSNNTNMSYTVSSYLQATKTVYTYTITVKNNNATSTITAWQLQFDIPSDFTQFSCASTVSCATSSARVTVNNGTGNGTLAAGATTSFTVNFTSYTAGYVLQNIVIAGTIQAVYQTISGLTMTATAGTRTKSGKWYYWPYTITVTNNSGSTISQWRIQATWSSSTNAVSSMPSTVNYVVAATQLTILSITSVANGASFQFVPTLGSTSSSWVLSGYSVQGIY